MWMLRTLEREKTMEYPSNVDLEYPINGSKYLFHYTSYLSALGILLSQQMRLGSLANMNDPLEFQDHSNEGLIFVGNSPEEECDLKIKNYEKAVIEKQNSVRLASFSMDFFSGNHTDCDNNLSKGWARSRMWAQYADNHKGVCLVFEKKNLVESFRKGLTGDLCKTYCRSVHYTNNLEQLKNALWRSCKSLLSNDKIGFLFQKSKDFRDEQEFRLLLINKKMRDDKEIVSFKISNAICAVIPGVRFPKEDELSLKEAMKKCNPQIKWLSICWNYGIPHLFDFERLLARINEAKRNKG